MTFVLTARAGRREWQVAGFEGLMCYQCVAARVFLRWSRIFEKKRKRKGGKEKEKRRKKKRKRITS
jgi:hypothetical protein